MRTSHLSSHLSVENLKRDAFAQQADTQLYFLPREMFVASMLLPNSPFGSHFLTIYPKFSPFSDLNVIVTNPLHLLCCSQPNELGLHDHFDHFGHQLARPAQMEEDGYRSRGRRVFLSAPSTGAGS